MINQAQNFGFQFSLKCMDNPDNTSYWFSVLLNAKNIGVVISDEVRTEIILHADLYGSLKVNNCLTYFQCTLKKV